MIKSKKLVAMALTAAFATSSLFTAYATSISSPSTTTVTVSDATDSDGTSYTIVNATAGDTELVEGTEEYEAAVAAGGYIYVTDTEEEPDLTGEDEDVTAIVEEQLAALVETLAAQGVDLVNETTGETVTVDDVVVAATVEIDWKDLGVDVDEAINWPITVQFEVPGATAENFVGAMHKPSSTGKWQDEEAEVVKDGVVSVKLYSFSPVAFLVVATESGTDDVDVTVNTDETDANTTDDDNSAASTGAFDAVKPFMPYVAAVVVVAALGCAVSFKRKNEA